MKKSVKSYPTQGSRWRILYALFSLSIASSIGFGVVALVGSPSSNAPRTASTSACPGPVHLTARPGGAAAGTAYVTVVVTNSGSRPCVMQGYPSIRLLGAVGARGKASRARLSITTTNIGGLAGHVVLAPRAAGEFLVVFAEVAVDGSSACAKVSRLVVVLPGSSRKLFVAVSMLVCDHSVRIEPLAALGTERP